MQPTLTCVNCGEPLYASVSIVDMLASLIIRYRAAGLIVEPRELYAENINVSPDNFYCKYCKKTYDFDTVDIIDQLSGKRVNLKNAVMIRCSKLGETNNSIVKCYIGTKESLEKHIGDITANGLAVQKIISPLKLFKTKEEAGGE